MPRPIIAIPTAEIPSTFQEEPPLWAMRSSYAQPLLAAGGTPVLLPQIASLDEIEPALALADGVLLAGGADIDPEYYGHPPETSLEQIDAARDRSEKIVLRWALAHRLPIFAICRGMQMVNVVMGGTLHQDIPTDLNLPTQHRQEPNTYANLAHHGHLIRLTQASRLHAVVRHEEIWVNSMHHQAVDRLGKGLKVVGRSGDGLIEAVEAEDPDYWLVAVQSHPEAMIGHADWTARLFAEFVTACAAVTVKKK